MYRFVAIAAMAAAVSAPARAAIAEPGGLGPALRASPNEDAAFMLSADGVHVYRCNERSAAPGGYAWTFVAPDATLYEGTHTIGRMATVNLWESLDDRSSVSGVVTATQPAGSDSLPWEKLRAQSTSASGLFAGVTTIQRVNTSGGAAPPGGCDAANVGAESQVPFRADFYFYKPRGTR